MIMRAGATSEMTGGVTIDTVRIVQDAPGIARGADGPLVTAEVVLVAPIPLISTGTDANVQVRGVSKNVLEIRNKFKIIQGRMFQPGLAEVVVGKNANIEYSGLTVGNTISLGSVRWSVVGVFDAGGSAFDSEIWADAHLLGPAYNRPDTFFQSVTVHLTSPGSLSQLKDSVTSDPRLNVDVSREIDYYSKQSTRLTRLITVLGGLVAGIMAIGAVFGALNTMYSALGCIAVLPLNGLTTGAMNLQTFSHLAFAFKITPELLVKGVVFALLMGVMGGLPPAIRAARRPVALALRAL